MYVRKVSVKWSDMGKSFNQIKPQKSGEMKANGNSDRILIVQFQ